MTDVMEEATKTLAEANETVDTLTKRLVYETWINSGLISLITEKKEAIKKRIEKRQSKIVDTSLLVVGITIIWYIFKWPVIGWIDGLCVTILAMLETYNIADMDSVAEYNEIIRKGLKKNA